MRYHGEWESNECFLKEVISAGEWLKVGIRFSRRSVY